MYHAPVHVFVNVPSRPGLPEMQIEISIIARQIKGTPMCALRRVTLLLSTVAYAGVHTELLWTAGHQQNDPGPYHFCQTSS